MKCVGIIGAMEQEVARLKEVMENVSITTRAGMDFYEGILEGKKVVVVQSGIGKVNAGMCTQILVDLFQVEAVINTGIAGSLNNDINIGDIVVSTDAIQHDMDATGFGYEPGVIPRMPVSCQLPAARFLWYFHCIRPRTEQILPYRRQLLLQLPVNRHLLFCKSYEFLLVK